MLASITGREALHLLLHLLHHLLPKGVLVLREISESLHTVSQIHYVLITWASGLVARLEVTTNGAKVVLHQIGFAGGVEVVET